MEGKRFSRSGNSFICGVCAGLAEYVGLDVTLMRVLWVAGAIVTWFWLAVIAYLVLALVMASPNGSAEGERFWHNLKGRNVMMALAALLIGSGLLIIAQQILDINISRYFFPISLILGGALLLAFAFGGFVRKDR